MAAEDKRVSNSSIENDKLIQQARLAEEARIKAAEEKRKRDKARAKKLREVGSAVVRAPKSGAELVERNASTFAVGVKNQLKSDEATRDAQYAERKAVEAASAYAKNPSESNKSKYQTAKVNFDKAAKNYNAVTGKLWPKPGMEEPKATPKTDAPAKTPVKDGSEKTVPTKPALTPTGKPMPTSTSGKPLDDMLSGLGIVTLPTADPAADLGGSDGPGSQGPSTSVSKSVVQYSAQQVKGLANQAFQQAIGREASADELTKFMNALNSAEKANPSTTVTKSNGSTSKSTTTGGVDGQQFAKDAARNNPEYAPYQQATTYFDAMLGALNGTVGRGI